MLARLSLWVALVSAFTLCFSAASYAGDAAQLDITGTLIKPPCTASFPASQSVDIPKVNLNSLRSDSTDWTDVALSFQCIKGSQVHVRFSAGNGSFDSSTLRTTLDKLGLKTRLSDMTSTAKVVDLKLGEQLIFPVEDTSLTLKLSVRPVKTGEELPAIGSYSSTLLMEIVYL
ncbi:fimbrial protein [Pseudomonas sp. UBA2684]|uniref:fimbrial protein n=1 Tax=Pseudomonas sp. UBA2684 TaxID=1947311 RepID=UPI0025E2AAAD|nr:fimbrial protein [Pseudomonas sp. UBA2684]|tara:strand:+ start:5999 stop:6517 length:519 start_codon:yes stop_codon:yes gene_type:complete